MKGQGRPKLTRNIAAVAAMMLAAVGVGTLETGHVGSRKSKGPRASGKRRKFKGRTRGNLGRRK